MGVMTSEGRWWHLEMLTMLVTNNPAIPHLGKVHRETSLPCIQGHIYKKKEAIEMSIIREWIQGMW
jgi:hypothetical protein